MTPIFRTFEISLPEFSPEFLRFITVKSPSLRERGDLTLFIPPDVGSGPLPVVILLHGVYGSHWAWTAKGAAHLTALRLIQEKKIRPMLLAMPSDGLWGDGSGYLPHHDLDFERWIVDEVPQVVRLATPLAQVHSPLFIAGLSMGGFGALRLGAKYPNIFHSFAGHSSITEFSQMSDFVEETIGTWNIPAESQSLAEQLTSQRDQLPLFRFDCGTEDPLIQANRKLHQFLKNEGIPHEYQENPGGHEWVYWQTHLPETLCFFEKTLQGEVFGT
jgi:putative tributyrin esterase